MYAPAEWHQVTTIIAGPSEWKQADHWGIPRPVNKIPRAFIIYTWGPDGQMTKLLHVYRPRQFQITSFWVNRPSGWGVPAATRFQEPLSHQWVHPSCPHRQMSMMLHIYRLRWFQWTWFQVNRPSGLWVPASARFQPTNGHAHYAPRGK